MGQHDDQANPAAGDTPDIAVATISKGSEPSLKNILSEANWVDV